MSQERASDWACLGSVNHRAVGVRSRNPTKHAACAVRTVRTELRTAWPRCDYFLTRRSLDLLSLLSHLSGHEPCDVNRHPALTQLTRPQAQPRPLNVARPTFISCVVRDVSPLVLLVPLLFSILRCCPRFPCLCWQKYLFPRVLRPIESFLLCRYIHGSLFHSVREALKHS